MITNTNAPHISMHVYMPPSYLSFEARNPRTMDSAVSTSRQANNLRNEKSSTGKSLSAGSPSTIGLAIAAVPAWLWGRNR